MMVWIYDEARMMLKKSASGVLASLRSSTYESVRLRLFAHCGLAGRTF